MTRSIAINASDSSCWRWASIGVGGVINNQQVIAAAPINRISATQWTNDVICFCSNQRVVPVGSYQVDNNKSQINRIGA